jgi:hypothetical protein
VKLLLDKRKQQLHEDIASTLELDIDNAADDYLFQIRIFNHWKQSGNVVKAGGIALTVGKRYESFGLAIPSARLYQDAISVATQTSDHQLEVLIKLHIAAGRALASDSQHSESVIEYQTALQVSFASLFHIYKRTLSLTRGCFNQTLAEAPPDHIFEDRSKIFQIFSGLFLLLKCGALPQDDECTYEQELVAQYVTETKLYGDPVHYARSLAMQSETLAKLSKFEDALATHYQLRDVYVPELHSERTCTIYGSDRAAQNISLSTVWLNEVGKGKEAMETCDLVKRELLPKMEIRNIHNSFVMLLPILWAMQDHGQSLMAYTLLRNELLMLSMNILVKEDPHQVASFTSRY